MGTRLMRSNFKYAQYTKQLVETIIPALEHHRPSGAGAYSPLVLDFDTHKCAILDAQLRNVAAH
jgi:hypothetical protein